MAIFSLFSGSYLIGEILLCCTGLRRLFQTKLNFDEESEPKLGKKVL